MLQPVAGELATSATQLGLIHSLGPGMTSPLCGTVGEQAEPCLPLSCEQPHLYDDECWFWTPEQNDA